MKWAKRIGLGLLVVVVLLAAFIAWKFYSFTPKPVPFDPKCAQENFACLAWSDFRRQHPFPYQTFAAKVLADGKLVLVISEPAPAMSKGEFLQLVKTSFGDDLLGAERKAWFIGTDGWVEDLVLTVRNRAAAGAEPMADQRMRDRVAILHEALYGSTFGGDVEDIPGAAGTVKVAAPAPKLHVTPQEIASWMEDETLSWQRVGDDDGAPAAWSGLLDGKTVGAFASNDRKLVLLTFPTALLDKAKSDPRALSALRVPFRHFAVSTDAMFGGVWTSNGQTALLGRARRGSLAVLPPLRFETFQLLAAQVSDELAQSYERTAVFAGKLRDDGMLGRDWAPIYLSPALVDTELGALLNITDQMLKSWSSAGEIEYLYFDYPKPSTFPFKGKSISDIVLAKEKASSVLFNWNTSGSTVVVKKPAASIMAINATSALPVTYGADGKPKSQGGADLLQYEEEAYAYFAGLGDPNLARVAQYTVMYQLFRAIANDPAMGQLRKPAVAERNPYPAGAAVLTDETRVLIEQIQRGGIRDAPAGVNSAIAAFLAFRADKLQYDAATLAKLLVDRMSPESRELMETFRNEDDAIRAGSVAYNAEVSIAKTHERDMSSADIRALNEKGSALKEREDRLSATMGGWNTARENIALIAEATRDLDEVRTKFLRASERPFDGAVKTPSSVLSWNRRHALSFAGGHNLDARAVRFEQSDAVSGMTLTREDGTFVLRYDVAHAKDVEAHAGQLARAVEHGGGRTLEDFRAIIALPVAARTRAAALALDDSAAPAIGAAKGFGRLGSRIYGEKKVFVDDLRLMAAENTCCVFVARDATETAYITEVNLKPPPIATAFEVRDTPSLITQLKTVARRAGSDKEKAVIFLDAPSTHVDAMVQAIKGGERTRIELLELAAAISQTGFGADMTRTSTLVQKDLAGRPSLMRSVVRALSAPVRALLAKLASVHPPAIWRTARSERLEGPARDAILKSAGWNPVRDGVPSVIKVSFSAGEGPSTLPELALIAGVRGNAPASAHAAFEATSASVLQTASRHGASPAQYLMTVRNELAKLPAGQIQRLVLVARENEAEALFTRLETPNEFAGGG